MKCPTCQHPLTVDDVVIVAVNPDEPPVKAAVDIVVHCPECDTKLNGFLFQEDMVKL